jgi:hypothetical protein
VPGSARRYRLEHGCRPGLPGDAALGLPAGELDPPPPAWLGEDEAAGADADDADPESAGVLAAGADVAPDPAGALGVDELDAPEHPAMAPARASAAAASSARLTRADEVINCHSSVMRPKRTQRCASPLRERYRPYDADTAISVGINRDNPHGCC